MFYQVSFVEAMLIIIVDANGGLPLPEQGLSCFLQCYFHRQFTVRCTSITLFTNTKMEFIIIYGYRDILWRNSMLM